MKSHPKGLYVIAGTELWDRISFHGMQALLVLYMVGELFLPGHVERVAGFSWLRGLIEAITGPLSTQALASQIFGLYVGLIYFTPVFGGLLGDRLVSRRQAVVVGALMMTGGHFCLAFEWSFFLGLLLLILGAGLLRGNLMAQVGELYSSDDSRRDAAFQIYYAMLNLGGFVAPLITGMLAQSYGWHYGFGFAGIGMLVGLVVYVAGQHTLAPQPRRSLEVARAPLEKRERRAVVALLLLLPILTLYWVGQSQTWNAYNFWARDHVDLRVLGWNVPIPSLQAFAPLANIILMPVIVWIWSRQAQRNGEPDDVAKIATGFLLFTASMAWLAASGLIANGSGKVPLIWVVGFQILASASYIYITPPFVALVSRSAPSSVSAMMLGSVSLAVFAGSTISGWLGGFYERLSPAQFWLLHGLVVLTGGVLLVLFSSQLRRSLTSAPAQPRHKPLYR